MQSITRYLSIFVLAGLLLSLSAPSGCSGGSQAVKTGVTDVVDCTAGTALDAVTTKLGDVEKAFKDSTDDHGSIDWGALEGKLGGILFGLAKDEATCIVATVVRGLATQATSATIATKAHPSAESVLIGFDKYRAAHDPGKIFHTSRGDQ